MAARVEELLAGFDAEQTPQRARERAEELVRTVVALYAGGLERLLEVAYDVSGDRAEPLFAAWCNDKLVESLLCLHDLHPIPVADRVDAALCSVLPYIKSHKGNMEVTRIEGDIVFLRLEGSCDGCQASANTLKLTVERAILERVPEISEVRAEDGGAFGGVGELVPGSTLRIVSKV
jgi:Fe-S cluster biogenesis protein NfuA